MKYVFRISAVALMLTSCATWQPMGRLNIVSSRNLDPSKSFHLIERDVEAIMKNQDGNGMPQLLDKICTDYRGEFVSNAKVFVKSNGKKIKIVGDVWGDAVQNVNMTQKTHFDVGDAIYFKRESNGKWVAGTIKGLTPTKVIVANQNGKVFEVPYEYVSKTEKVSN